MCSVRDTDLLRVMAISSCTKQQKNTTVKLAESSMAIRRRNNSRFESTSEYFTSGRDAGSRTGVGEVCIRITAPGVPRGIVKKRQDAFRFGRPWLFRLR